MAETLNFEPLEKAISQLSKGLELAEADSKNDLYRDGVIQRFEYTMDLAWKFMQRVLKNIYQIDQTEIPGKKDIFRKAAETGLIADAEAWITHYNARNQTSHDYNSEKADLVYAQATLFLPDVKKLLETLKSAN